jgi:tricorn protease
VNIERGGMGLVWSPDSKWLAYAKSLPTVFQVFPPSSER